MLPSCVESNDLPIILWNGPCFFHVSLIFWLHDYLASDCGLCPRWPAWLPSQVKWHTQMPHTALPSLHPSLGGCSSALMQTSPSRDGAAPLFLDTLEYGIVSSPNTPLWTPSFLLEISQAICNHSWRFVFFFYIGLLKAMKIVTAISTFVYLIVFPNFCHQCPFPFLCLMLFFWKWVFKSHLFPVSPNSLLEMDSYSSKGFQRIAMMILIFSHLELYKTILTWSQNK